MPPFQVAPALGGEFRAEEDDEELGLLAGAYHTGIEASLAAALYRTLQRRQSREIDFGIAACALNQGARLWTLNPRDFGFIPDLVLVDPSSAP